VEAWPGKETCHVPDFVTSRMFFTHDVQGLEGQRHRDAAEQVAPRRSDSASCAGDDDDDDDDEKEEEEREICRRNEDKAADSSRGNIAPARRRRASSRASRSESSSAEPGSSAREMESARSGEKYEWSSLISSLERMQLSVKKLASVREKGDGCDDDVAQTDYQRADGCESFGDGAISSPVGKLDFSFLSDDGIHEPVRYPPVSPGGASTEYSASDCDTAKRSSQSAPSRHRIDVRNFPFDFEVGEKKDTAPFELCGDDWFLRLYPGGFSHETDQFVGVFLCYAGTNVPITVNYSVTAVVEGSRAMRSLGFQGKTFTKRCQGRGWDVFVKRESLRAQSPAGCFSLIVDMDPHEGGGGVPTVGLGDENAKLHGRDKRSKDVAGVGRGNVMTRGLGAEECSVKGGASGKARAKGGNSRAMWKPRAKPGALRRL
jgi:hypothetical protein